MEVGAGETLVGRLLKDAASLALGRDQLSKLRHAYALQRGTKREKARAQQIAREVLLELGSAIAETVALEQARGSKVERLDGRLRCHGRDGLAALFDDGRLTGMSASERAADPTATLAAWAAARARLDAGLAYREMCEYLSAGLRSQLGERVGSGGAEAALGLRIKAAERRDDVEHAVMARPGAGARGLRALRAIAAEGALLSSLGGGGKSMRLDLAALIIALDAAINPPRRPKKVS
jgi:hypothetical protein